MRIDRIIEAALDLAEEHGVPGVTTAALARRLEFTEAALYRYFPGKGAILAAALDHLSERLFATMLLELMPESAGTFGVEFQLDRHIRRFSLRHGLLLDLVLNAASGREVALQKSGATFLSQYDAHMSDFFTQIQHLDLIGTAIPAGEYARLWICQLLGGFVRARLAGDSWDPNTQPGFIAFSSALRRAADRHESELDAARH